MSVGERKFVEPGDRRSEEKWRAALDDLCAANLVRDEGGKGNRFSVTNEGYSCVDTIRSGREYDYWHADEQTD